MADYKNGPHQEQSDRGNPFMMGLPEPMGLRPRRPEMPVNQPIGHTLPILMNYSTTRPGITAEQAAAVVSLPYPLAMGHGDAGRGPPYPEFHTQTEALHHMRAGGPPPNAMREMSHVYGAWNPQAQRVSGSMPANQANIGTVTNAPSTSRRYLMPSDSRSDPLATTGPPRRLAFTHTDTVYPSKTVPPKAFSQPYPTVRGGMYSQSGSGPRASRQDQMPYDFYQNARGGTHSQFGAGASASRQDCMPFRFEPLHNPGPPGPALSSHVAGAEHTEKQYELPVGFMNIREASGNLRPQSGPRTYQTPMAAWCRFDPARHSTTSPPYPVTYFLYGSVANLEVLKQVLRLTEEPKVLDAKVIGYEEIAWEGKETILPIENDITWDGWKVFNPEVLGVIYDVATREQERCLEEWYTAEYSAVRVKVHLLSHESPDTRISRGRIFLHSARGQNPHLGMKSMKRYRMRKLHGQVAQTGWLTTPWKKHEIAVRSSPATNGLGQFPTLLARGPAENAQSPSYDYETVRRTMIAGQNIVLTVFQLQELRQSVEELEKKIRADGGEITRKKRGPEQSKGERLREELKQELSKADELRKKKEKELLKVSTGDSSPDSWPFGPRARERSVRRTDLIREQKSKLRGNNEDGQIDATRGVTDGYEADLD